MRSAILLAVLTSPAACSGSQDDTSSRLDASVSADADANTCIGEAGSGIPCMQSLADYCANGHAGFTLPLFGGCGSTWQSVQAGPPCQAAEACGQHIAFASCASADAMFIYGADTATIYVYDPASGALVAVVDNGDGVYSCPAGPACFTLIPPNCGTWQKVNCGAADGGGEAEAGDTGVIDATGD